MLKLKRRVTRFKIRKKTTIVISPDNMPLRSGGLSCIWDDIANDR